MTASFAVVAALAVVSGAVAWLSLWRIESELAAVVGHAVPAMTTAEALAVEATAVANATGTLTAALTEEQRTALMVSLAGRISGLKQRLAELRRLEVEGGLLAPLDERISVLAGNLARQSDLVRERIALATQIRTDAAQLADGHKQFLSAVNPRIENTYRSLFAGIKTLVDDIVPTQPAVETGARVASFQDMVVLQRRIGHLFNRNVGEMLALLQLAAAGNLAAGLLNEAILVNEPDQVRQLRARFTEVTISMGAIRLNLPTTPENQVLLGLTTPMLQYGLGSDNLFDRRLRSLDLLDASHAVVTENVQLSEALTEAVDTLLAAARAAADRSARDVQSDAAYARLLQTLAAGFSVLIALLIGWRYVGRQVIGRVLALQTAMEGEAAGREIVIPADGDDEIGDMAVALGHFVARRKQAEADLVTAKERAESAFAELKELQETLVQAEKMAALGGLVAGVAHELNTPVGVCMTAASLLTEKTEELARGFEAGQLRKSKVQEYLDVAIEVQSLIRSNLERAGDLVRVFKQVAIDPGEADRQIFRVQEQLEIVVGLQVERIRATGHTVTTECPPDLTMDGFSEALRQALTVLLENALTHAFPANRAGTVTLTAAAAAGNAVTLSVADDGAGISAEDQRRLFEPFFTTRRGQGGIGLGLHMAFNIVSSVLGGRIVVESEPGAGARFTILIPATSPAPARRR